MKLETLIRRLIVSSAIAISSAFAQEHAPAEIRINPSIAVGELLPFGNELTRVFDYGHHGQIGLGLSLPRYKLILEPQLSATWFVNKPNASTRDNLRLYGVSLDVQYNIFGESNRRLLPFAGVGYLHGTNFLTPSGDTAGERIDLIKTSGLEYHFGLQFEYGRLGLRTAFSFHNPAGEIDDGIRSLIPGAAYSSELYGDLVSISESPMNFNYLKLVFAIKLN